MAITTALCSVFSSVNPGIFGLVISFAFGLVVLTTGVRLWLRIVLYVLNSLVIFSVAAGSGTFANKVASPAPTEKAQASLLPDDTHGLEKEISHSRLRLESALRQVADLRVSLDTAPDEAKPAEFRQSLDVAKLEAAKASAAIAMLNAMVAEGRAEKPLFKEWF